MRRMNCRMARMTPTFTATMRSAKTVRRNVITRIQRSDRTTDRLSLDCFRHAADELQDGENDSYIHRDNEVGEDCQKKRDHQDPAVRSDHRPVESRLFPTCGG